MSTLAINGGTPVRKSKYLAYHRFGDAEKAALSDVIDNVILSTFYGSRKVVEFEELFADYHGMKYAVATNSGTAALHIAYLALDIQPGDEIIVPANAYISAATAALQANAIPIFADIHPETFVLDPARLEEKITPRTKMIVPVHLYGQPVDMASIMCIAKKHNLLVVEDCAQAHGAKFGGQVVGTFGHVACYSLCCRKHVVAGEGGVIITNDMELAKTARSLVNKGKGLEWWDYQRMGYSYLMTDLQAVIAISSLKRLDEEISQRRTFADIYRYRLSHLNISITSEQPSNTHIYFKLPFLLPQKYREYSEWFDKAIQAENVVVERSYPVLYHIPWINQKEGTGGGYPYKYFEHGRILDYNNSNCLVAEDICYRLFAACTGPGISEAEILETCTAIEKVYDYLQTIPSPK